MSKQSLDLQSDWEKVVERFLKHFSEEKVEIEEETLEYTGSGESLEIKRSGEILGEMPLHKANMKGVREIIFSEEEVRLKSDKSSYSFRR